MKEALAANDWAGDMDDEEVEAALEELDLDNDDFPGVFAAEDAEMSRELLNMKTAVHNEDEAGPAVNEADEASQVEELERMMVKMQAIKGPSLPDKISRSQQANTAVEKGSTMAEPDRKRFAAKAVADLMREMEK